MNRIKGLFVWLSRINKCQGFGVQSPFAYQFIRYVINEHAPYYLYEELNDRDWLTRKLGRLYFRLSNWKQPEKIVCVGENDRFSRFFQAGCRRARIISMEESVGENVVLWHVSLADTPFADIQKILEMAVADSVLVIEGIYSNREARSYWQLVKDSPYVSITFDLYYCGIVFFDKKRIKQYYVVNF